MAGESDQYGGGFSFPKEEKKILKFWFETKAFENCLKESKGRPRYTFYDGPPFATGLPHYGHILAGTVKDIVTRWAHMMGFHVDRRFGWDTHGLPVEFEIDKKLGIKGPEDVEKMGIKAYNDECRKIVSLYSKEWEYIVSRMGRWIDFKNDYKTMYPWFMESIWWVFKQLYDKGFVYKGFKVMPFSTACSTPLSNFESGQNYKDVDDPAVVVSFPLLDDPAVKVVAWTTTPWTLPSNLSLCVHPDLEYVKVKELSSGAVYILMEARLLQLFKSEEQYQLLERFKGSTLEGKSYQSLFPYFEHVRKNGAFKILMDNYVTSESGTGIVHQAPYFGEDDFRVCLRYKIISKDSSPICPIDMSGKFTDEVTHFVGMHVKEADKHIIKWLKEEGRLVSQATTCHSYPFCWRSDTPLIYRAIPSWFIRVESMKDKLLETNKQSHWVPDYVKEGRFANWLKDARDWAVSRNRYWGTPIPLWVSDDGEEIVCIGSIAELEEYTGEKITDLHRDSIDHLTIPSRLGRGQLRRISEVFDCWFESGSMPYAQLHYPFENKKEFEEAFPGDFIAEGIDQTRGWFYTLMVLSTALFGKPAFKNLICHGLVLSKDGQKMSKSKKNYPDPMDVVDRHGADAVRLYLINSPVVRADNLRFKEEGVRDVVKDVFLPWYNASKFLLQNIEKYKLDNAADFSFDESVFVESTSYMDRWIVSFTQSLIGFVRGEMAAYRLYAVMPRLVKFVDQLTKWHVRMNRRRLKGDCGSEDAKQALNSLFQVIHSMVLMMSPFVPFLTEKIYQSMRVYLSGAPATSVSVHSRFIPTPQQSLINCGIEAAVSKMQAVIELGRIVRERNMLPMKYPLNEIVVIHRDAAYLADINELQSYIIEELNVRKVTTSSDKEKYNVCLKAEIDYRSLGGRIKESIKDVAEEMKKMADDDWKPLIDDGVVTLCGHAIRLDDVKLTYKLKDQPKDTAHSSYQAHSDSEVVVLLDVTPSQSMQNEGLAREAVNRIQKLRKKANMQPSDDITVFYDATGALAAVIEEHRDFILQTVKQPLRPTPVVPGAEVIVQERVMIKDEALTLSIVRGHCGGGSSQSGGAVSPHCRYVNIEYCDGASTSSRGTILLENPVGDFILTWKEFVVQVRVVFGLHNRKIEIYEDKERKMKKLDIVNDMTVFHQKTLFAFSV